MKEKGFHTDIRSYIHYYRTHTIEELDSLDSAKTRDKTQHDVAYVRGILNKSQSVLKHILRDPNVDEEKLIYKDQEKTKQEDRLLLLFFLNNGIIDTKLMGQYNIPLIYLSILAKTWDITQFIRGIYSLDKLCTYWQQQFADNPTLIYAVYNNDKMVVAQKDLDEKGKPVYSLYVSKKYQGNVPEGDNIKITYVDEEKLKYLASSRIINRHLKFYEYMPVRKFCEQANKMKKLFHKNIVEFIESEDFDYLYLQYKNIMFTTREKEKVRVDVVRTAKELDIEDAIHIYDFLDKYYKRK